MLGLCSQVQTRSAELLNFDFNEGTTDSVTDSVNGLVGTPTANAPTSIGDAPSGDGRDLAIHFESGQYITVQDPDTVMQLDPDNPSFTLQAWVKFEGLPTARMVFFYSNGPGGAISFSVTTDRSVFVTTLGILDANSSAVVPDDGEWHHIAVVHENGVELRYYVDGVLGHTREYTNGVIFTRTQKFFTLGAEATGGLQYVGSVDRLKVSSGVLTADQLDYRPVSDTTQIAPSLASQPSDATVDEGGSVTFAANFDGSAPMTLQWFENDNAIPGANSISYTIDRVSAAMNGAKYKCTGTNPYGAATSNEATLTVIPDTTAPVLVDAGGSVNFDTVRVWFSESLDPDTAEVAANYALSGGVTVSSASLSAPAGTAGDHIVVLSTSQQPEGTTLTLTVNNVTDVAGNTIAANSTVEFGTFTWAPGYVLHEFWSGITGAPPDALLNDPRYPNAPTFSTLEPRFEYPPDGANEAGSNYGNKLSAWFVPQTTGTYVFYVCSDDQSRLYLSTDADPANKHLIAQESGWSAARNYVTVGAGDGTTRNSEAFLGNEWPTPTPWFIDLTAGERYYIEMLHTEGGGGDNTSATFIMTGDLPPADGTASTITGNVVGTYFDPNTELEWVTQPTDQQGVPVAAGDPFLSEDFTSGDGGFTVVNTDPAPPGPFVYSAADGAWVANGGNDACGTPNNSQLNTPEVTLAGGAVFVQFTHRYNFEPDLWDAGIVRYSLNGGAFEYVPAANFLANGYAEGAIIGAGIANGLNGFNAESPGYASGDMITSLAFVGNFSPNDTLVVQFAGAWDECTTAAAPNWVISSVELLDGEGAVATFSAEAMAHLHGDPVSVNYQWQRDDGAGFGDIAGATGSSWSLLPRAADMDAQFRVVVTVPATDPNQSLISGAVKLVEGPMGLILNVVETGGDNEPTDTIAAQWTGQTFVNGVANEPIPGSVAEDPYTVGYFGNAAPAFVDRNHRYLNDDANSLPVPAYLVGGEYIMSGNDNRDNDAYVLDVTVSQAVDVFMLIDNRTNKDDGSNTSPPNIGPGTGAMEWIDETWEPVVSAGNRRHDHSQPDEVAFDEGADDTINQWYSVYRKQFPAGTFQLLQANNSGRNMYGAVVTVPQELTGPISIVRNEDGTITVEWSGGGVLEAATSVTGPWAEVPGATSPYTFTPSEAALFGRVRK